MAAAPMSLRAYARRRGTSAPSVLRAIKGGRLSRSLVYVGGVAQIADPDLADQEWAANTDLTKAPGYVKERAANAVPHTETPTETPETPVTPSQGSRSTMADAALDEKRWKARLAEQEFLKEAGELVNAKRAVAAFSTQVIEARTKLLAVPSKVKARSPDLTLEELAIIDEEIRRALESIAGEG